MFQFESLINLLSNYSYLLLIALIINISITFLRTARLKNFINIKELKSLFLFLSFHRVANYIIPFKLADVIQVFFFKKILLKNKLLQIISLLSLTKFLDMFLTQIFSVLILIIFILKGIYSLSFIVLLIVIFDFVFKNKKKIIYQIKKFKKKIKKLKNTKSFILKIYREIDYMFREDLLNKSIFISILNYLFILIIIYISTDQTLDREIFFLVFIFTILQPIPLRLFFGIGFFDFAVYISNFYFGIGIELQQLLLFRFICFVLLLTELLFVLIFYIISLLNVFSKKYK